MSSPGTGGKFVFRFFGAAFLLMLTLAAPPAPAAVAVPFKGIFDGTFAINPLNLQLHFSGDGPASHMGDSGIVGDSQLAPAGPGCFQIVTDVVTLTAANGDHVVLTNTGQDCFDNTGHIVGTATYLITGGTGRFAGATGSGVTQVVASPDQSGLAGTFVLTMKGDISY